MQMSALHAMHLHVICQHTALMPLTTSSLAEVRLCTAVESKAISGGLRMACQAGLLPPQAMECHSTQLWALSCGGQLRSAEMRRRRATWASAWPWESTRPSQVGAPGLQAPMRSATKRLVLGLVQYLLFWGFCQVKGTMEISSREDALVLSEA